MILGLHNDALIHLPISMIGRGKRIDPEGWQWQAVLQATHQPANMTNDLPVSNSIESDTNCELEKI